MKRCPLQTESRPFFPKSYHRLETTDDSTFCFSSSLLKILSLFSPFSAEPPPNFLKPMPAMLRGEPLRAVILVFFLHTVFWRWTLGGYVAVWNSSTATSHLASIAPQYFEPSVTRPPFQRFIQKGIECMDFCLSLALASNRARDSINHPSLRFCFICSLRPENLSSFFVFFCPILPFVRQAGASKPARSPPDEDL